MFLSYRHIINTSLTIDEIFTLLQKVTIPYNVHSIFVNVRDYVFYEGKFEGTVF